MKNLFLILSACFFLLSVPSLAGALDTTQGIGSAPKPTLTPTPYPPGPPPVSAQASGKIQKRGTTTYMYGTHILSGTKIYALKSDTISLDLYIGKNVRVSGKLIGGYPVSGGPEFMNVDTISQY